VVSEARLEAIDSSDILDLLTSDAASLVVGGVACELEREEVGRLISRFNLSFDPGDLTVRIRRASGHDDLPYQLHTGRELALMLEGRKPLAAFSEVDPPTPDREVIPEQLFDPYVAAGRFIKGERIFDDGPSGRRTRRVLYALPQERWRIEAYLQLWETATKVGWNEEFERTEGSLLGYEDWQNDIFIEQVYRPSLRPRGAS
jgi:hypothetical protein